RVFWEQSCQARQADAGRPVTDGDRPRATPGARGAWGDWKATPARDRFGRGRRAGEGGAHGHPPSGSPTSVEAVSKPSSTLPDAVTAVPVRGWRPPEGKCRVSKGLSSRANGPGPCARTGHGASTLDTSPPDRHNSMFCFDFRTLIVSKGRSTLFRHFSLGS